LIGEWTLGEQPHQQGFDEFAGYIDENATRDYFPDYMWRYGPKMIYTNGTYVDYYGKEQLYPNVGGKKGKYLPELIASAAVNFITINHATPYNLYQPFFLLVNFPAPRSAAAGKDEFPVPSDAPYTDEPWPQAAKDRASLMTRIDGDVGRFFETFKKLGMTNNFIVIFSSSAPPEKFANRQMDFLKPNGSFDWNDASTPAPMIVYGPQWVPPGRMSDINWSGADLGATIMQLSGVRRTAADSGESHADVLTGHAPTNAAH
jgi:arylsulfatase A-like enzyme